MCHFKLTALFPLASQEQLHQWFHEFVLSMPSLMALAATCGRALQRLFVWAWDCVSSRSMYFNGPLGKVLLLLTMPVFVIAEFQAALFLES
jgi:hypothetical protein